MSLRSSQVVGGNFTSDAVHFDDFLLFLRLLRFELREDGFERSIQGVRYNLPKAKTKF